MYAVSLLQTILKLFISPASHDTSDLISIKGSYIFGWNKV